jgi:hypothetical protein
LFLKLSTNLIFYTSPGWYSSKKIKVLLKVFYSFMSSFSLLAQRKRTKRKGRQSLVPLPAEFTALFEKVGRCKTRGVYAPQGCSNSSSAIPSFSVLLGCVKCPKK